MSICYIMLLQSSNKIVTMSRCLRDAAAINGSFFFPGIDQDQGGTVHTDEVAHTEDIQNHP